MTTAERTIEILVPVAEDVPEEIGLTASLSGLEGKVVGLLENRKYHADTFMQETGADAAQRLRREAGRLRPQGHLQRPASRRQAGGAAPRVRRHHPRHRRLRKLHGVGSPRHGSNRIRRRSLGQRHHQQLHPRRQPPRRLPGNARRPHRSPPQPPGVAASGGRAADGPRLRAGNRGAADRGANFAADSGKDQGAAGTQAAVLYGCPVP